MKIFGRGVAAYAALVLFAVIVGLGTTSVQRVEAQTFWKEGGGVQDKALTSSLPSFVGLAERLTPSVVNISTTQVVKERSMVPLPEFRSPFEDFFGDEFRFFNSPEKEFKRQSLGSGFIINHEGYILTNNHVIENASEIIVTLSEQKKEYKAKVIGQDAKLDVALIKIDANHALPAVALGNSEGLRIGEWVLAIGNPFGLGGTLTAGIVSQKGRIIGAGPYDNFIQTDASINPGNSGGPLFNLSGEVVGINTAIIAGGQGIGFATPVNMVKDIILQLKDKGRVVRGWIGVTIQEISPELAESFGLKDTKGALVSSVIPGDPAEAGGIRAGDIIIEFNGKYIDEMSQLPRAVAASAPETKAIAKVIRNGKQVTLTVIVGEKKEGDKAEMIAESEKEGVPEQKLGISVQPITPGLAERYGLDSTEGVLITAVRADSPSGLAGLRRGDIIKEINRKAITNIDDYRNAMKSSTETNTMLFLIKRGASSFYVALQIKP